MRRLTRLLACLSGLAFSLTAPLAAQDYTGTWTIRNRDGGTITLDMAQDAQGKLTGRMAGNGVEFRLEGTVQQGTAVGALYQGTGGVYFQARLEGRDLTLTLIEPGADGKPDFSRTRQLALSRSAAVPQPSEPPASSPAPAQAGAPGGRQGLLGTWSCQTNEGPAQLAFTSDRNLSYNNQPMSYILGPGTMQVTGPEGVSLFRYTLAGDELTIVNEEYNLRCRRGVGSPQAAAPEVRGGGGGAELLQGQFCSFSSSADGGWSTLRVLTFDGRGRFQLGSEVSTSNDAGLAWGRDPGKSGTYQVAGASKGAAVTFVFGNGERHTGAVHHVYQGQITELMIEGVLYGMAICK